jgi:hypothetical protein
MIFDIQYGPGSGSFPGAAAKEAGIVDLDQASVVEEVPVFCWSVLG